MACKQCESLIKELIELSRKYRHSYFVNGMRDALSVVEDGNLDAIRQRDNKCLTGTKDTTEARAETRQKG